MKLNKQRKLSQLNTHFKLWNDEGKKFDSNENMMINNTGKSAEKECASEKKTKEKKIERQILWNKTQTYIRLTHFRNFYRI